MKVRRPKGRGSRGGKGTRDGGSTHLKLMRKAAKKSGVVGKLGKDRGRGRELGDENPGWCERQKEVGNCRTGKV